MLTEIYCEAFGEEKTVPFFTGLNVIQGYSDELDGNGNSIGKTNMLKIIDCAFGGQYYFNSNEDVVQHVGEHAICFTHVFHGKEYRFVRTTTAHKTVFRCSDSKYTPISEWSVEDFCEWLSEQYGIQDLQLSFRKIVDLYSRIWNKPNKEVNRPLYQHNAQSVTDAIISLIKLFGKYGPIQEFYEQDEYLKERLKIFKKAVRYHLLEVPSKREYHEIKQELAGIQETIQTLRANVSAASSENVDHLNARSIQLYDQRALLLAQQGRIRRALQRCRKNMTQLAPPSENTFLQLKEFFPEVNLDRIQEVQGFHNQLRLILSNELKAEEAKLQHSLEEIDFELNENNQSIQNVTGLTTHAESAMEQMLELAAKEAQLQGQLALYEDNTTEVAQKAEIGKELTQMLEAATSEIQDLINEKILTYSESISTSNSKAPSLHLTAKNYKYGVEGNTGTGKAYTDLLLFDMAVLSLTRLPILIHDSFLFNNIDDLTKQSFIRLYSHFSDKQIFISLDQFYGKDNEEINQILFNSTRLTLTGHNMLYGRDWRKQEDSL